MKTILINLFTFFIVLSASAHAVFIETSLKGTKGKLHTVKIVYGEPDEHELISKWWWYKDGTQITLTLIKPDGSTAALITTAQEDHLLAHYPKKRYRSQRRSQNTVSDQCDSDNPSRKFHYWKYSNPYRK